MQLVVCVESCKTQEYCLDVLCVRFRESWTQRAVQMCLWTLEVATRGDVSLMEVTIGRHSTLWKALRRHVRWNKVQPTSGVD